MAELPDPAIGVTSATNTDASLGLSCAKGCFALSPKFSCLYRDPRDGALERLVIDAKAKRIAVVDRRRPLAANPKAVRVLERLASIQRRQSRTMT